MLLEVDLPFAALNAVLEEALQVIHAKDVTKIHRGKGATHRSDMRLHAVYFLSPSARYSWCLRSSSSDWNNGVGH